MICWVYICAGWSHGVGCGGPAGWGWSGEGEGREGEGGGVITLPPHWPGEGPTPLYNWPGLGNGQNSTK